MPLPAGLTWGPRVVRSMPLEMVFQHLAKNELFRLSWGAKNTHGEEWERLQAEFEARLERMTRQALREGWLQTAGGLRLLALPGRRRRPGPLRSRISLAQLSKPDDLARFTFPRQPAWRVPVPGRLLCPASSSGQMDMVALQVVTVGQEATERFDRLQAAGDYSEAYFTHGLAVQTAEATAEYLHRHIRRELGLPDEQGKRYSWGYPAIPELEDHRQGLRPAAGRERAGHEPDRRLPAGPGAVHRRHHRAPPAGQVLQHRREPGGAADEGIKKWSGGETPPLHSPGRECLNS